MCMLPTLFSAPTGPPLNVMAASISSTSIRVSWQAPLRENQNGEITSYHINIVELETELLTTVTTASTDSIYVVNSLHPFYHYNCSVAAFTNGLGPLDFDVVQTLPEGVLVAYRIIPVKKQFELVMFTCYSEPSESPSNVGIIATNATTVVVSWLPPRAEDRNGVIQGYTLRVVGVHTREDFTQSINLTDITISGLHPFYTYKFTVAAFTISLGPFSNPKTLMMPSLGKQ